MADAFDMTEYCSRQQQLSQKIMAATNFDYENTADMIELMRKNNLLMKRAFIAYHCLLEDNDECFRRRTKKLNMALHGLKKNLATAIEELGEDHFGPVLAMEINRLMKKSTEKIAGYLISVCAQAGKLLDDDDIDPEDACEVLDRLRELSMQTEKTIYCFRVYILKQSGLTGHYKITRQGDIVFYT